MIGQMIVLTFRKFWTVSNSFLQLGLNLTVENFLDAIQR